MSNSSLTSDPDVDKAAVAAKATHRRRVWGSIIAFVIVLAIALPIGLGVGLSKRNQKTGNQEGVSNLAPTNDTGLTVTIARPDLLGDPKRWYSSSRDFTVSSEPTTRHYNWTISEVLAAPGALERPWIVVNGQSPGPLIEANLGDRLIISVFNNLTNETAIHWHGMHQRDTNFMDGTYGITQCGIPPGGSMTYNWTVQNTGTTWWHAHRAAQYTDGLLGALILHDPNETAANQKYDDDITLMLSDTYNTPSGALMWRYQAVGTGIDGQPGDEPSPDGGAINGVSQAKCAYIPASNSVLPERRRALGARSLTEGTLYPETNVCGNLTVDYFNVTLAANGTYRLRLINSGSFVNTIFSIDGHTMTVIEADGTSIVPFEVSSLNIAVAQRYSVLVTLNQTPGAYWIRNVLDTSAMLYSGLSLNDTTLGVLRYEGVEDDCLPADAEAPAPVTNTTLDGTTKLVPADAEDAPAPTTAQVVQFNMQYTADNQHYMFFNTSSWTVMPPGQASLFSALDASNASAPGALGDQVSFVNPEAGVMDLVVNSLDDGDHPFHLHGHTFWVVYHSTSHFYGDTSTLNVTNPMRRDTILVPSYGGAVLRFKTDNPGVWAFHCHISWHMANGLLLTVTDLAGIKDLQVPAAVKDMCVVDAKVS